MAWGRKCPLCGKDPTHLLSTTNEWKNHCTTCDVRFNDRDIVLCDATEIVAGSDYRRKTAHKT